MNYTFCRLAFARSCDAIGYVVTRPRGRAHMPGREQMIPDGLKYTKTHEWVRVDGTEVTCGITDHAQSELGDVVFVELPEKGRVIKREEAFGTIESVKAVSDLYAPVGGTVSDTNTLLGEAPETINKDPYGDGWLVKISISGQGELEHLMSAEEYGKLIGEG
jgi:glycine cleavage system H protein